MKIKIINDEEEILVIDYYRYERNRRNEVCDKLSYITDSWELFIGTNTTEVKSFLKRSYEVFIIISFDDDFERIKKMYTPSITIKKESIIVETLINYNY